MDQNLGMTLNKEYKEGKLDPHVCATVLLYSAGRGLERSEVETFLSSNGVTMDPQRMDFFFNAYVKIKEGALGQEVVEFFSYSGTPSTLLSSYDPSKYEGGEALEKAVGQYAVFFGFPAMYTLLSAFAQMAGEEFKNPEIPAEPLKKVLGINNMNPYAHATLFLMSVDKDLTPETISKVMNSLSMEPDMEKLKLFCSQFTKEEFKRAIPEILDSVEKRMKAEIKGNK